MKMVEVYLEQEIELFSDKKSLFGYLLIEKVKIDFCLLLSDESTEKNIILQNNFKKSVFVQKEENVEFLELENFELKLFRVFLLQLANRFIERRIVFREIYKNAKSEGPTLIRFGGTFELSAQFCKVLNRLFSVNIDIFHPQIKKVA